MTGSWLRRLLGPDGGDQVLIIATGVGRTPDARGLVARVTLAKLIRAALAADARLPRKHGLTSEPWVIITQGSYSPATPGEAHDRGGAIDLRSRHLDRAALAVLMAALLKEGFGLHDLSQSDAPHLHLLAPWEGDLTVAAKRQYATSLHKP